MRISKVIQTNTPQSSMVLNKLKRKSTTSARGIPLEGEVPDQSQGVELLEGKMEVNFRSINIHLAGALRDVLKTHMQRDSVL